MSHYKELISKIHTDDHKNKIKNNKFKDSTFITSTVVPVVQGPSVSIFKLFFNIGYFYKC